MAAYGCMRNDMTEAYRNGRMDKAEVARYMADYERQYATSKHRRMANRSHKTSSEVLSAVRRLPLKLDDFPLADGRTSKLIVLHGRPMVVVDIDGTHVPFYVSTGSGKKAGVAAGRWYPIFGIGRDGWFNKGWGCHDSEFAINSDYFSPKLKGVADTLMKSVGNILSNVDAKRNAALFMDDAAPEVLAVINQSMDPQPWNMTYAQQDRFFLNVLNTVYRVEGEEGVTKFMDAVRAFQSDGQFGKGLEFLAKRSPLWKKRLGYHNGYDGSGLDELKQFLDSGSFGESVSSEDGMFIDDGNGERLEPTYDGLKRMYGGWEILRAVFGGEDGGKSLHIDDGLCQSAADVIGTGLSAEDVVEIARRCDAYLRS